jgi:hypothetical protein
MIHQNKLAIVGVAMFVSVMAQIFRIGAHGALSVILYVPV